MEELWGRARWRTAACSLIPLCLCGFAPIASAQTDATAPPVEGSASETGDDSGSPVVGQARESFKLGVALARQGQWAEALRALRRSEALHSHPVTTYNIGYAERALGRYTRAYESFAHALHEHDTGSVTLPADLERLARGYVSEVQSRLAHVAVTVEGDVTALSIDGKPLQRWSDEGRRIIMMAGTRDEATAEPPPAATFEMLIDPGTHIFVLSRQNEPDVVVNHTFEAGASISLTLGVASGREALPPAPVATPTPSSSAPTTNSGADETRSPYRPWAWVAYGVGGAGLVAGTVFLAKGLSTKNHLDADPACNQPGMKGVCPNREPYISDLASLDRDEVLAMVGFGVGIIGVAAGTTILLLTRNKSEPGDTARKRGIEPWLGAGAAGVRGAF